MVSTSVSEVSSRPVIKWTRSEWFGAIGREVQRDASHEQADSELNCVAPAGKRFEEESGTAAASSAKARKDRLW